jgi:hypothetical protein
MTATQLQTGAVQMPGEDELVRAVFEILGVRVEVVSASVGLLHYWSSVYGAFRIRPAPAEITIQVTSRSDVDGPIPGDAFITVGGRTRPWDGREELFPPLGTSPLDRLIYLHGAVVGRAGQAALVLSGPGRGKTMLTVATLARGAWLLSDGVVPIDPHDLLAIPFPKTLRLRREALELLSIDLAHPALMPFRTRSGTIEWWARPDELLGWRSGRVAADVGAIVALERADPGAQPKLEPLRPREALQHLLGQLYQPPSDFQGCMDALVKLCRRAPAYRLAAGAPGPTAKLLDEALLA